MAAMDPAAVANAEVQYYYASQLYHTAQITARAAVSGILCFGMFFFVLPTVHFASSSPPRLAARKTPLAFELATF